MVIGAPVDPVGGAAAGTAARDELRHPEYHRDDPGLLSRAMHWLGQRLGDLFTGGAGGSHAILLVVVVLLAIVVFLAVRAGAPARSARVAGAAHVDLLDVRAARDHRRLAAQLAAEGRNAEALREWLRAAVATITERGVLPPRPGRTGAATAREAGPVLPAAAVELAAATRAFDEVWFGGRDALVSDVATARAAADAVGSARLARDARVPDGSAVPW